MSVGVSRALTFARIGGTVLQRYTNGNAFPAGEWVHILVTHDGTFTSYAGMHIYVNGTEVTYAVNQNGATETAPTGKWCIGGRTYDDVLNLDGKLDEVGVWDRVLDAGEIASLASGRMPRSIPSGLIFDANLDKGSLVDSVTSSTGTADGTTVFQDKILYVPVVDTSSGSDNISIIISSAILKSIADSGTGIDANSLAAALGLRDGGVSRDFLGLAASLSLFDSGVGSDLVSLLQALFKTVTDTGIGLDRLNILASLTVPDTGFVDHRTGADVTLTLLETGRGSEVPSISASLSLLDLGTGIDNISILIALLKSIQDNAYGIDGLNIAASLSLVELPNGNDGLSIRASLTVPDNGSGLDNITVTQFVITLIQILDAASGLDRVSIAASLNIPEASYGIDANAIAAQLTGYDVSISNDGLNLAASLSIVDTSSANDVISILSSILKSVQDLASGTDFVGQISASLSLADSGLSIDKIGQLLASLAVIDLGNGVDTVVTYDLTTRIVKISFIIGSRAITFAEMSLYRMDFSFATRDETFSLVSGG